MRAAVVIGLVVLAGCAWGAALGEEVSAGTRLANGRYALGAGAVVEALTTVGMTVRVEQVQLPGTLSATVQSPALRVTGAEARGDGRFVVRLRCGVVSECLPFFAEVRMSDPTEAETAVGRLRAAAGAVAGARVSATGNAGEVAEVSSGPRGVSVGTRVRLELADAQMRIALPGIAVDTGAPGSEVRVTSLDRRHTYRGVVVDAGTVKGGVE